jgi:hypothetical protein
VTVQPFGETRVSPAAPNGADVLRDGDPELAARIARHLVYMAAKARSDPKVFFEFVMVTDDAFKRRVKISAHQRVLLDFIRDHHRGVVMMSRGHSKTFCLVSMLLWMIGNDPNFRGAVVGAKEAQSEKVVKAVREAIGDPRNGQPGNPRLLMVFPHLRRSPNKFDPWTMTSITVAREAGTRDPTLIAVGLNGIIRGARLKCVFVDDVLTDENVGTHEQREKVVEWVDGAVLQTLDRTGDTKAYLVGTALHPQDLLHKAQERGWASLKMDVAGNVQVEDDKDPWCRVDGGDFWDHPELRAGYVVPSKNRLVSHDPDPRDEKLLWPERFGRDPNGNELPPDRALALLQESMLPHKFQQEYMMVAHDYATAMCRPEWITRCKLAARQPPFGGGPIEQLAPGYQGQGLVFVGVDLAYALEDHNDDTAYVTVLVHDSGHRQILDIEYGKFDSALKVQKVREKVELFSASLVVIEGNSAQRTVAEWSLNENAGLPVVALDTGREKADVHLGIQGLFLEIYNGAWIIPNDEHGVMDRRVQRFVDACINYVPDKHTDDVLMAAWLAHKGMRRWGVTTGSQAVQGSSGLDDFMLR